MCKSIVSFGQNNFESMLKKITPLFFILILIGCKDTSKIDAERLQISNAEEENVPLVEIDIPKAVGDSKLSKAINKNILDKLIEQLVYDETAKIETLVDAIHSFKRGFFDIKDKFPKEEVTRWEAKIVGEIEYETKDILTIKLESYNFTGGAHGYESTSFLNFDKKKAKQLGNDDLVLDSLAFVAYAEKKFRTQEKIMPGANINDTGFMFESEEFQLPENMGYTKDGLQLLYNTYEIASYTDGQITLILPYEEVEEFLKLKNE